MFGFDEVRAGDEALTSFSGLTLLGLQLQRSGLSRLMDALEPIGRPDRTSGGTIATSLCGLIALGHPDFDRIEALRSDPAFGRSLGLKKIPSSPTLRQRAEALFGATRGNETESELATREATCERAESAVRSALMTMQRTSGMRPTPLTLSDKSTLMPVDMDTTVLEEPYGKKEGVGCTYQKVLGYSPMLAYIGREGYILDGELRPGPQSAHTGTREAIARARAMSSSFLVKKMPLFFRLDGGCDSQGCLDEIENDGKDRYIVVHNRRGQSLESWLAIAQANGTKSTPRVGKTVWFGETRIEYGDRVRRCVFRATERTSEANGQQFLVPDIEIRLLWTNLDLPAEEVFALYADHGTSEQFHAEYKSDLGMEQFPSADYRVNRVLFLLGCLVFNALRLLGQESLKRRDVDPDERAPAAKKIKRRRLRSVINDIVRLAGRVVTSGRRHVLSLGKGSRWIGVWLRLHRTLVARLAT